MTVSAHEHPGTVLPEAACTAAVAVLHVVAGAIPDTQLEMVLPMGDEAIENKLVSNDILSPPLLPQLQSRLVHLTGTFTELVRRFGKSASGQMLLQWHLKAPGWISTNQ